MILLAIGSTFLLLDMRQSWAPEKPYLAQLSEESLDEQRRAKALENDLETTCNQLVAREQQLAEEQADRKDLEEELRLARQPQTNTLLVALIQARARFFREPGALATHSTSSYSAVARVRSPNGNPPRRFVPDPFDQLAKA